MEIGMKGTRKGIFKGEQKSEKPRLGFDDIIKMLSLRNGLGIHL